MRELSSAKTHSGNFTQGQTGASYSITVGNGGTGATSAAVTVTDTLPAGVTETGVNGKGGNFAGGSIIKKKKDGLGAGGSYPANAFTGNVANNTAARAANTATVSGGGESNTANDNASDVTAVTQLRDLTIAKTHSGNFTQGQTGASYSITVGNGGTGATSAAVTVTDTLPAGLTATGMSGTGWDWKMGTLNCTRGDALGAGSSYPAIKLTVNVDNNAAASLAYTADV